MYTTESVTNHYYHPIQGHQSHAFDSEQEARRAHVRWKQERELDDIYEGYEYLYTVTVHWDGTATQKNLDRTPLYQVPSHEEATCAYAC